MLLKFNLVFFVYKSCSVQFCFVSEIMSNRSDNATSQEHFIYAICATGSLIFIGNLVVFVMACVIRDLRNKTHVFFILSLSFIDIFVGISSVLFSISSFTNVADKYFCFFILFFLLTSLLTSSVQTFLICIERYFASSTINIKTQEVLHDA